MDLLRKTNFFILQVKLIWVTDETFKRNTTFKNYKKTNAIIAIKILSFHHHSSNFREYIN